MASVSHSSRRTVATYEHASSVPPTICPESAGKQGARGNPGSPNSSFPWTTASEDPGADGMSPMVAFWDGLDSGSLDVSTRAISLKDKGVGGSGQATDQ
jgi:hypothetical protein